MEQAEIAMLVSYVEKAGLKNGMHVLDLGCAWGALGIFLAEVSSLPNHVGLTKRFPEMSVTCLSDSVSQKVFVEGVIQRRGMGNVRAA